MWQWGRAFNFAAGRRQKKMDIDRQRGSRGRQGGGERETQSAQPLLILPISPSDGALG